MTNKIKLTVFDTQKLQDITDDVDHFELKETKIETYAWLTIKGERIGLCAKREEPSNNVYSIRMENKQGIGVHRLLEVADEIQNTIPVMISFPKRQNIVWERS